MPEQVQRTSMLGAVSITGSVIGIVPAGAGTRLRLELQEVPVHIELAALLAPYTSL